MRWERGLLFGVSAVCAVSAVDTGGVVLCLLGGHTLSALFRQFLLSILAQSPVRTLPRTEIVAMRVRGRSQPAPCVDFATWLTLMMVDAPKATAKPHRACSGI
jgi:hypothetical protein